MTKTTAPEPRNVALAEALDSIEVAPDHPDFEEHLRASLDAREDEILAQEEQPAKPARTARKAAAGATKRAPRKAAQKAASPRSQAAKAPARKAAKPQPEPKRPALAEEPVREDIARQLRVVKIERGVVMRLLSEFTGFTSSQIGRAEQGRAYATEVETYTRLFIAVESGELRAPEKKARPRTAATLAQLEQLAALVRKARGEKTVKARTALLDEALDLLTTTTSTK